MHNGHGIWPKTSTKRAGKARAKAAYVKHRNNGVSAYEMKTGLLNEVAYRKKTSIRENKLTYLRNPATWLQNEEWRTWIESGTTESKIVEHDLE